MVYEDSLYDWVYILIFYGGTHGLGTCEDGQWLQLATPRIQKRIER